MNLLVRIVPVRLWTRRCHGCAESEPHNCHLTWLGKVVLR